MDRDPLDRNPPPDRDPRGQRSPQQRPPNRDPLISHVDRQTHVKTLPLQTSFVGINYVMAVITNQKNIHIYKILVWLNMMMELTARHNWHCIM